MLTMRPKRVDQHIFQQRLSDVEEAVEARVEHTRPLLARHPEHEVVLAYAGIVNQYLDVRACVLLHPVPTG